MTRGISTPRHKSFSERVRFAIEEGCCMNKIGSKYRNSDCIGRPALTQLFCTDVDRRSEDLRDLSHMRASFT